MQLPTHPRSRVAALAVLALAGFGLLLLPSSRASGAQQFNMSNELVRTIDDMVGLLDMAVKDGNRKEARHIERDLEHLIKDLEHLQSKQHHHHHHNGGKIHKGMHFGENKGNPFDSLTGLDKGTSGAKGKGKGRLARGMSSVGSPSQGQSSFGSGANQTFASGASGSNPATGSTAPSSTSAGRTGGGSTRSGVNSGIQTVSSTITNDFYGPADVNINNGQQQIAKAVGSGVAGKKTGKSSSGAVASQHKGGTPTGQTTTAAAGSKTAPTMIAAAKANHNTAASKSGTTLPANQALPAAAHANHQQIASVGKMPTATHAPAKQHTAAASKTHTPATSHNLGQGNRVGASVGTRSSTASHAVTGKKK